jgi:NhaP-type Na+/H+ or K+/H+ antiporter
MTAPLAITLQIVATVITGIGAQVLAEYLKIPGIVLLLLFGIALGPSGVGVLHPEVLGDGLEVLVGLLVAIILFDGGFSLQLRI